MSFNFFAPRANDPVSPERQRVAQAMLQRKMLDGFDSAPAPTNIGSGIEALGQGIADGLELRSLNHQANAPTDAWADMRTRGQTAPGMGVPPMGGFGLLGGLFRNGSQ